MAINQILRRFLQPATTILKRGGMLLTDLAWHVVLALAVSLLAPPAMADSSGTLFGFSSQFIELSPKRTVPNIAFIDESGRERRLAEFRGKVILLNIWATWCPPCVYEMPALARLADALRGEPIQVIAIAIDPVGLAAVKPFFRRYDLGVLRIYLDPDQRGVFTSSDDESEGALPLYALPISFFVDQQGKLIGYLKGAADWGSADARNFLAHLYQGTNGSSDR